MVRKQLKLALKRTLTGCVDVVLIGEDGQTSEAPYVLGFTPEGRIIRPTAVNPNAGLKLDKRGRIQEWH